MTKFTQTYPTDLKYTEWQLIEGFFPTNYTGRPRKWEMWQIVNAILFVDGDQLETDRPITWVYSGVVLLLPVDQGVSRNGMAWLFYATSWTDSNMVWMDAQSRLLGNYRYARINGRMVAIGSKDEAYICGGINASVLCVCIYPGEEEPRWELEFDTAGNPVGGALIPGRLLISVSGDGLYVFGK
jgi:hypothetical protein